MKLAERGHNGRMRALVVTAVVVAALFAGPAASAPAGFQATVSRLEAAQRERMTGVSWQPGCPVALADLRLLTLTYHGFDGGPHTGRLVVHRDAAATLVGVFRRLYAARFPIRRMRPVDVYGGSDFRSIEADNSSAFNCRRVEETSRWSNHAYGRAIDVNPIENPYVTSRGTTSHPASRPYLDRRRARRGMATPGGTLVRAFRAAGWGWGGDWSGVRDYQHFSADGR